MKFIRSALMTFGLITGFAADASTRIEVLDQKPSAGEIEIAEGLRLGELLQQRQTDPQSYWLGASWQRQSLLQEQRRLKASVLFDLTQVRRLAQLQDEPDLAAAARQLSEQVIAMPVTGRRVYPLDPLQVELRAEHSPKLQGGDRLIFPARPNYVRVTGAVVGECTLPFAALQPAYRYAQQCPALAEADPDYLYLIQPDGQVTRLGIALWNREDHAAPPAPGAVLLIPLDAERIKESAPELSRELADFLATQPLPVESP